MKYDLGNTLALSESKMIDREEISTIPHYCRFEPQPHTSDDVNDDNHQERTTKGIWRSSQSSAIRGLE